MFCKEYRQIGNNNGKRLMLLDLITSNEAEVEQYFPSSGEPDIEKLKREIDNFPSYDNMAIAPGTKIYIVSTGNTEVIGG